MPAVVGAVLLGNIVGQVPAPSDIESDSISAVAGTLNVHISAVGSQAGFIVVPVAATVLAGLVDGPCSVIISQGVGSVTQAVLQ